MRLRPKRLIVTEWKRTCVACPSQWEGTLQDNRVLYIRYRWGALSFGVGATIQEAVNASDHVKDVGGSYDGFLADGDMLTEMEECGLDFSMAKHEQLVEKLDLLADQ